MLYEVLLNIKLLIKQITGRFVLHKRVVIVLTILSQKIYFIDDCNIFLLKKVGVRC